MVKSVMEILDIWRGVGGVVGTASLPVGRLGVGLATPLADMLRTLVSRNGAGSCGPLDLSARTGGSTPLSKGEGTLPGEVYAHFGSSRRRGGSVADPPRDPGGPISAPGPPRGGGTPQGGGKAAAVTKLDVKARETQVAVVPPRPSPPPPCQSLKRASSWTACALPTWALSGSMRLAVARRRRPRTCRARRVTWRPHCLAACT